MDEAEPRDEFDDVCDENERLRAEVASEKARADGNHRALTEYIEKHDAENRELRHENRDLVVQVGTLEEAVRAGDAHAEGLAEEVVILRALVESLERGKEDE